MGENVTSFELYFLNSIKTKVNGLYTLENTGRRPSSQEEEEEVKGEIKTHP